MIPDRCPHCATPLDVGVAGPRLGFCRPCRRWWTCGGRPVDGGRIHRRR